MQADGSEAKSLARGTWLSCLGEQPQGAKCIAGLPVFVAVTTSGSIASGHLR